MVIRAGGKSSCGKGACKFCSVKPYLEKNVVVQDTDKKGVLL